MTQESPVLLCYDCRTPIRRAAAEIRGEKYCDDCAPAAAKRLLG